MKVKGIELMQMIADGKIKDGTEIICCFTQDTYFYNDHNKNLICKGSFEDITDSLILGELITANFEILEDKTEEIEEIKVDRNNFIHTELGSFKGRKMDIAFVNKFNELTKIVNKLNKQDTSKETNCMSE